MIDGWIKDVKATVDPDNLGMILVHNGVVRSTAKDGKPVRRMELSYSEEALAALVKEYEGKEGIAAIRVWINKGALNIGDDIMLVLVAGRFRTDVLPVFQSLIAGIKGGVVNEREIA
jgi:molybdopterin synthase catalytic subunit